MSLEISGYVDPGTYQQEVNVPSGSSATSVPFAVGIIGVGNRNKRSVNEAVIRGKIYAEPLTPSGSPATDSLASRASRRQSLSTLYRDGTALPSSEWYFTPASVVTDGAQPYNCGTPKVLVLALDGRAPISIELAVNGVAAPLAVAVAAKAATQNGFVATISDNVGAIAPVLTALTAAEIAAAINATLLYATDARLSSGVGYGPVYATAASVNASNRVVITSPSTDASSDVAVYPYIVGASDAGANALAVTASTFAVAADGNSRHAKTSVVVNNYVNTSTYTLDYVAYDTATDAVVQAYLQRAIRVGNYAGVTSYKSGTDYAVTSAAVSTINWSGAGTNWTSAAITGLVGPFNLSTTNKLSISIDGRPTVVVDLTGATPAPGGAAPSNIAAATAAEVAALVNSTLAANLNYGPRYASVASVVSTALTLTSPTSGAAGLVEISAASPTASDASGVLFTLASSQLPHDVRGVGAKPVVGQTYFGTYEFTRATSEYNVPKSFTGPDTARADLGYESVSNPLMVAANLAFRNGAPQIYVVQVNDLTQTGSPTQLQLEAALDAAGGNKSITDVVMLDTRSALRADLVAHVTTQCGPTMKHPRRAWIGMPKGTVVGDRDTANSFIAVATQELQVPADSPARGRFFLMAPAQADFTFTLEDGSEQVLSVDGSFLAVAVAAHYTARSSPSVAMVGDQILGLKYDTFPTFQKQERLNMASAGVLVLTAENNKIVMKDPLSTERGGGKLPQFEEPSASSQKDSLAANIDDALTGGAEGVVPSDLADFILSIKTMIGDTIESQITSGAVGPYRDSSGRVRKIDYTTDIQVFQSKSDPRTYLFRYYFMLRYPAKRFFGEYSVDNPFFQPSANLVG
jgi:hypothetical protein